MGASTSQSVDDEPVPTPPLPINELRQKQAEIYKLPYTHNNTIHDTTQHNTINVMDTQNMPRKLSNPADDIHNVSHNIGIIDPVIVSNSSIAQLSPSVDKLYRDVHHTTQTHAIATNQHQPHSVPFQHSVIQAHQQAHDNTKQSSIQLPQSQPHNTQHNQSTTQFNAHSTQTTPHKSIQITSTVHASSDVVDNHVWRDIVVYVNNDSTIQYNAQSIADAVLSIPFEQSFIDELTHYQKLRYDRKKLNNLSTKQEFDRAQQAELLRINDILHVNTESINYEIATGVLSVDKQLSKTRRVYVPSRVSEDIFWVVYFTHLKQRVQILM